MHQPHVWATPPSNPNVSIWRYLRVDRFVDLLERRQLHFARLDQFHDDPWEGVLPPATVPLAKDHLRHAPINPGDDLTDWEMLVRDINRLGKLADYANCWFTSEHDSVAMWRLYSPEGVAIRSTYSRLCASLVNEPEPVHIGEVRYLDFRTEQPPTYGNTIAVAFYKGRQYEHERELRAVVIKHPADWKGGTPPYEEYRDKHPKFMKIASGLDTLIERIYLAPGRADSLRDQVREALTRNGLDKPIEPSSLDDRPTLI